MVLFKKRKQTFVSPVTGECVPLEKCNDPVFSKKLMGEGVAIYPESSVIVSPCEGEITLVSETKHAFGLKNQEGIEMLIHIGIDTVELGGKGFATMITKGQKVKKGETLVAFDKNELLNNNIDITIFLIFLNIKKERINQIKTVGSVIGGEDVVAVLKKD